MTELVDLMGAGQAALYQLLAAAITDLPVGTDFPENTQPPWVMIAQIDTVNEGAKDEQQERLSVYVTCAHRGQSRKGLIALMHRARTALDRAQPVHPEATFGRVRFIGGASDKVSTEDGATYAGVLHFEVVAQPA